MSKPETKHLVADEGFDLFYTPGTEPIVGLKSVKNMLTNYKKNNIAESSTLLADTMYSAREVKKITWQGSFGGSGILTQALQILHDQNKSKFKGHAIYLYHPTTNSRLVQNLANKLEFDSVSVSKSYTSRNEIRGNHLANMISPRNIVSMADTSLSTAATLGTLLALTGVIFSPVIGLVAAGVAVGKLGTSIKKNHIAPTYKK